MNTQVPSKAEISERSRWEERYGDVQPPLKYAANDEFIQIGDEFFSRKELEAADKAHPQPANDPFKPHHYLVQKALDDLNAYYKLHPTRKMRIK